MTIIKSWKLCLQSIVVLLIFFKEFLNNGQHYVVSKKRRELYTSCKIDRVSLERNGVEEMILDRKKRDMEDDVEHR